MAPPLSSFIRTLRAFALVGYEALRVWWFEPRSGLEALLEQLSRGSPTTLSPALLNAVLERSLSLLPPWWMGRCVKRSLILYALWSRCGLQPAIQFEVRRTGDGFEGHLSLTEKPRLVSGGGLPLLIR